MNDNYRKGREDLTDEEETILNLVKIVGKPIKEHEFHMMMEITQTASGKKLYQFELGYWEHINENFRTSMGAIPISKELHNTIDSLVKKNYLSRNSENPLTIYENNQLNLL